MQVYMYMDKRITFASSQLTYQGCVLAEPGGSWRLTFALARRENLRFFIQIIIMLGIPDFTALEHWAPFNFP